MRIPHAALPVLRTTVLLLFTTLCASIFGFLWLNSGGKISLLSRAGYQVHLELPDADNLVFQSDVRMAGVDVGKIENIAVTDGKAHVTLQLDPKVAPLHQGATVTVRNKTMVEETYLEVADGRGEKIPSGQTLPGNAGRPSVQLDDVLTSLDEPTRQSLGSALRSAGAATEGTRTDVGRTMQGLGEVGRGGGDALHALAAQSRSLEQVTGNTTALLHALDTREGRIAQVVQDSAALTNTVSANRQDVEALMRTLPPVLSSTNAASGELQRLAGSLAPVTSNIRVAAPDMSAALRELFATTNDLRGLLPSLNRTLDGAPQTLHRVPGFSQAVRPILPTLEVNLGDVNPMLAYLQPYGRDVAAFFTNFSQFVSGSDANGNIARVLPVFNEKTPNSPLNSQVGPLNKLNPYPRPGESESPGRSSERAPRVEEEGLPR